MEPTGNHSAIASRRRPPDRALLRRAPALVDGVHVVTRVITELSRVIRN
jgi:hypothetical protein